VPQRVSRGFVQTGERLVHYRRAGSGPPVVLLHDSPRSSVLHLPLLAEFSDAFTVFALDTPGYGQSDPLPASPRPEIDDFGDALAAALLALGLERPVVYAYHTSSKIALSCALRHSHSIGQLVIDGLSLPQDDVPTEFIDAYMSPFDVDPEGAYISRQWTKIRDLHRFFPWFDRQAAKRIPMDEPPPVALHAYAMDLFMAGENYSSAYSAAMRYRALRVLRGLSTPTTFMAREDDVLYPYLEVVEACRPSCASVERLPSDHGAWRRRLREIFSSGTASVASEPQDGRRRAMRRDYQAHGHGQLQLRRHGDGPGAVIVLHDPPGSALDIESVAAGLRGWRVVAPDLPGCGLSDPLGQSAGCADYGRVLLDMADAEGLDEFALIATGLSVPFALHAAATAPSRVNLLVLDGMPVLEPARRRDISARYAPEIRPTRDGSHFLATWHRLRDEQLQWPWYDGSSGAARRIEPDLDGQRLHQRMVATLQQPDAYGQACRAALSADLVELAARVRAPLFILDAPGDPRYEGVAAIARSAAAGQVVARPHSLEARGELLQQLLSVSGPGSRPPRQPP
jgi:pimeloyl-ACP methyl ester carboxylesterase